MLNTDGWKTRTATFVSDDNEAKVRYMFDNKGRHFAIHEKDGNESLTVRDIRINPLLFAESLQFLADVVSEDIPGRMSPFVRGWTNVANEIHSTACDKGFWEDGVERNDGEMLCLIHSEISEALEALRAGNPPDDKLPTFNSVEVELADAVIRIMDLAEARGWQVAKAIEAKAKFNKSRPFKHGKKF